MDAPYREWASATACRAISRCDLLAGGPNGYNSRMALIANPNC
jgi:hypothetical protein